MGFIEEISNRCLIKELERELNRDVVLLGVDGLVYFGSLQEVDDDRIAVLGPAATSSSGFVEVLTAANVVRLETFVRVDLCTLIGKGTSVAADPFAPAMAAAAAPRVCAKKVARNKAACRGESHELICELKRQIGDLVFIVTLGGFYFEGTLVALENELAVLSNPIIIAPGNFFSSLVNIGTAVVNLEALTSSGVPAVLEG